MWRITPTSEETCFLNLSLDTTLIVTGRGGHDMDHEQTFRIILILGFVAIFPMGAWHRIKAQATGEKLDRRQEGLFILLTLRPTAAAGMVGLIAYAIDPSLMAWSSVPLPIWLRWLGVMLGITSGLLLTVTFRTLGKNLTDTVVTRAVHVLVMSGSVSVGAPSVLCRVSFGSYSELSGNGELVSGSHGWNRLWPNRVANAN